MMSRYRLHKKHGLLFVAVLMVLMTGCTTVSRHHSSSVVEYLYPDEDQNVHTPQIPHLSLPLTVGIAFVPESKSVQHGQHGMEYLAGPSYARRMELENQGFTEKDKLDLMNRVSDRFREYPFVKSIEIIPSAYLRPGGSFTNLGQISRMFGTDVIVLLSYDQTQFTDEGVASISYWTLFGAYFVEGEKNDTHTMIDAAVYHVPSRKLLFRAPGISHVKGTATPINIGEQLRADSLQSFTDASEDLTTNLKEQLELFKDKVKERPEEYKVTHKAGYTGAGSIGAAALPLMAIVVGCWIWDVKRRCGYAASPRSVHF